MKYVWFGVGFTFAATIVNPNYTRRTSFYLRKFNVLLWGTIGYAWGRKKQEF